MRALVADDREDVRLAVELLLKRAGHAGEGVGSPREVKDALARSSYDVVLLDLNYTRDTTSGREGLDLIQRLQRQRPELPVVAMTAWGSVELAVEAMREGARDFVLKPWEDEKLLRTLERHGRARRGGPGPLDLDRAGRVQARFRRALPAGGSLECAGACVEAGAVGGDVFDVLDLGPGHVGLLVGDAVGKGVSGALLIAYLQSAIRAQSLRAVDDLAGLAASVNRVFFDGTAPEHFATLFLGVWDEASSRLRYVNCAHPAPVVRRRDGSVERLRPTAFALGLFEDGKPPVAEARLAAGDLVVAFTDGVVEARREDEEFGDERLLQALEAIATQPAEEIAAGLLQSVASFATDEDRDDRAVLVARVREARA
jgi:sigma-B regulation protein RsbU (phosphoserine phosphatase)